jgi:hypothetical protein
MRTLFSLKYKNFQHPNTKKIFVNHPDGVFPGYTGKIAPSVKLSTGPLLLLEFGSALFSTPLVRAI